MLFLTEVINFLSIKIPNDMVWNDMVIEAKDWSDPQNFLGDPWLGKRLIKWKSKV